jgi:hypothetical protein
MDICHCGVQVAASHETPQFLAQVNNGLALGYCTHCIIARCDAYPGACERPTINKGENLMSTNQNAPKPKPPVKKPEPKQEKKPYKRKEHLSYRPFSDEALFEKLRQQASEQSTGMKNPRRVNLKEKSK